MQKQKMKHYLAIGAAGLSLLLAIPFSQNPTKPVAAAKADIKHSVLPQVASAAVKVAQTVVAPAKAAPPPAPVAPPAPAPRPMVAGCEQYRSIFEQYNWNVGVAMAIMQAESGCRWWAKHVNDDGSVDYGLMQLNQIAVLDPAQNIKLAYDWKFAPHGWSPWTTFTSGKYLQFLK